MVQRVDYHGTKPRDMWKHIVQRDPVLINGIDKVWENFTNDLMTSKAGDVTVMVEQRSSNKESYGQGRKAPMQLAQFIKEVEDGNTGLYMSTQEVGVGRDGHPLLYGPPLIQLVGEFPVQQQLMGNLVPQSINMWMGCAPEGSSTGLHHDFHDNLYVLLRGCKRFRLHPPDAAPDMYVRGSVRCIYPNGRIVYEEQGDILPDGSDKHDVQMWQARHDVDEAAAAASAAPSHADAADEQLEQQLERMLNEGAEFDDFGGLADDYLESDEPADLSEDAFDDDFSDDFALESDGCAAGIHATENNTSKRQRKGLGQQGKQHQPQQSKRQKLAGSHGAAAAAAGQQGSGEKVDDRKASVLKVAERPPPSFSQVDLSLPESVCRKKFPRFPGVAACQEVLLQAGQMLYMPAGWFHEVTSFGSGGLDGGHLAVNYWYHPPDNLDSSKAGFKHPYTSPYYPTIWAQRQQWLVQDTQQWWERKQQTAAAGGRAVKGAVKQEAQADDQSPHNLHVKTAGTGRHIAWDESVHSPTNKYRMSMTKQGTATSDGHKSPLGSKTGAGPCCGTIGCIDIDGGSESDSTCSSREKSPAAATAGNTSKSKHKQQQQQHAGHEQHAARHADECMLHRVSAAVGTKPYAAASDAEGSGGSKGVAAAAGKSRCQTSAAADAVDPNSVHGIDMDGSGYLGSEDDRQLISKEVQEGISAIEDYFNDNPEAMKALLAEFMQQRRQRMAAASRAAAGGPAVLALPRLFGRRHHHYASVKMVPRKPASR